MFKKGDRVVYTPRSVDARVLSTDFEVAEPRYWIAYGRGKNHTKVLVAGTDLKKAARKYAISRRRISQMSAALVRVAGPKIPCVFEVGDRVVATGDRAFGEIGVLRRIESGWYWVSTISGVLQVRRPALKLLERGTP
jgi:hypothetical protein